MAVPKIYESKSHPPKVLVVDDAVDARYFLTYILKSINVEVDCACNGQEALTYLQTHEPPSLIILDLHMPVMDGREFYRHQRSDERLRSIPVLLYTSASEHETEFFPRSRRLSKDISLDQLLERVNKCVHQPTNILIVDDNCDLLDCLRITLETAGFTVWQASNAYAAIEQLEIEKIDAVVTDLEMPGMNGLDLANLVKKSYPHVSVVLMSGWLGANSKTAALAGADAFFPKPVAFSELIAFLRKAGS